LSVLVNENESKNYERILIAARLEQPDAVPIDIFPAGDHIAPFAGLKEREYYLDPNKMLSAQLKYIEEFCRDDHYFILSPLPRVDFSVVLEAGTIGARIIWPENSSPYAIPMIKEEEDVDRLEIPDCEREGLMAMMLEYMETMQAKVRGKYNIGFPYLRGPVTLAAMLRGINEFMVDIRKNPEMAHKLLEKCTEVIIECARVIKDHAPSETHIGVYDDISGFLNERLFREFSLPYLQRIYRKFPHPLNLYHNDADTTQLIEAIAETGAKVFNPGDPNTFDLAYAKKKVSDKICIAGNVAPYDVLVKGSPKDVEAEVIRCLKEGAEGGGFILSTGGIASGPKENIHAMIEAGKKYGKYPISL